jgi:hypothetical protein
MITVRTGIYRTPEDNRVLVLGRGHHATEDVVVYQMLDEDGIELNELIVHGLNDFAARFELVEFHDTRGTGVKMGRRPRGRERT